MLYIEADHRGFKLKKKIKKYLEKISLPYEDLGAVSYIENDDYPDYAKFVAQKVSDDKRDGRGIVICGSGVGMDIVANKFKNVRSGLCFSPKMAEIAKRDDNINVLALAADFTSFWRIKRIIKKWIETNFADEEKYLRRIRKIEDIESEIK